MSSAVEESIDLGIIREVGRPAATSPLLVDFKTAAGLIGVGIANGALCEPPQNSKSPERRPA